jgi:hypothetical protein
VLNYKYGPGKNTLFANADNIRRHVHSEHLLKGDIEDRGIYGSDAFENANDKQMNEVNYGNHAG